MEPLEDRLTPTTNLDLIDASAFTGSGEVLSRAVAVDAVGNTYIVGDFGGVADFDPGPGVFTLSNGSDWSDAFLVKLNADGSFAYAKQFGGGLSDFASNVALDGLGNLYISGLFEDTAQFGATTLTSVGATDAFVAKLDADTGDVVYAKQFGGPADDGAISVTTDGAHDVYAAGYFQDTAQFGPTTLTSAGGNDAFVAKLDADTGDVVYAKQFGGLDDDVAISVSADGLGNVYVAGYFRGEAQFGPTTLTSAGSNDAFVAKLDAATGDPVAVQQFGGTNNDIATGVAADGLGNVYAVGFFEGAAQFGTTTLTSAGNEDAFVARLDAASFNVLRTDQFGGVGRDLPYGVAVDGAGSAYVTGEYGGEILVESVTSSGGSDVFVLKVGTAGIAQEIAVGGPSMDSGYGVEVDGSGNVYVTGSYRSWTFFDEATGTRTDINPDFDPGTGTAYMPSSDRNQAGFLAKFGDLTVTVAADDDAGETAPPAAADPGQFTFTRSAGDIERTINYTVSGTATPGTDYQALSGTVTFAAGSATATVTVTPINDTETEGDETVIVSPSDLGSYTASPASATVTIADNEPEVRVEVVDEFATEPAGAGTTDVGRFRVTRTGDTTDALTVNYTFSGSATAGLDYVPSGSVVIPAGASSALVTITPLNDALTEGAETVTIKLSAGAAYAAADPLTATLTIFDNEPEVRLIAADSTAVEGTADTGRFTVTRTGSTATSLIVRYSVYGSATAGSDYAALTGTVTIATGSSSADITVTALADSASDNGETVVLSLENDPAYAVASPSSGQVNIAEPASGGSTPPAPTTPSTPAPPAAPAPTLASAIAGPNGMVYALNSDGTLRFARNAGYAGYTGTVSVALGDLNNDGVLDVVTGTTTGLGVLRAFDGATGADMGSLMPFGDFGGGINVAAGDIDGDHYADVLVGAASGSSQVVAISGRDGSVLGSGPAFPGYTGGVTVALGDLDGDHLADIIVGSASGVGVVSAYSGATGGTLAYFLASPLTGVNVAAGDLDGDGLAEIVAGTAEGPAGVGVFTPNGAALARFLPFGASNGGAHVAVTDRDNNGDREITAGAGPGGMPLMAVYSFPELALVAGALVFDPAYLGGIPVA